MITTFLKYKTKANFLKAILESCLHVSDFQYYKSVLSALGIKKK